MNPFIEYPLYFGIIGIAVLIFLLGLFLLYFIKNKGMFLILSLVAASFIAITVFLASLGIGMSLNNSISNYMKNPQKIYEETNPNNNNKNYHDIFDENNDNKNNPNDVNNID